MTSPVSLSEERAAEGTGIHLRRATFHEDGPSSCAARAGDDTGMSILPLPSRDESPCKGKAFMPIGAFQQRPFACMKAVQSTAGRNCSLSLGADGRMRQRTPKPAGSDSHEF